ncbi:hypothetical protein C8J56DRAFT_796130, partial [Mycena floridula]
MERPLDIWRKYKLPVPTKVLGDINVTLEPLDRRPHNLDKCKVSRDALQNFIDCLDLTDGWRNKNEGVKDYTYILPESQSRLDRIYTTVETEGHCRHWTIDDCVGSLSDHRMVSVEIYSPTAPFQGKGRYTMRLTSLENEDFLKEAEEIGIRLQPKIEEWKGRHTKDQLPQSGWKETKEDWVFAERERAKTM